VEKIAIEPRVENGAVLFNVVADSIERECVVSKNALAYLSRLKGGSCEALDIYAAYHAQIHKVAKRLVTAGENASPLVLGAGYFIDLLVQRQS
jgi:hypothetical protein